VADLVTISSTGGRVARPGSSVYNLTKFGAAAFCEALRQEMLAHRVRVSMVEPGTVDTELITHLREDIRQAAKSQTASIEPLRPDDIADTVAYIVTRDRRPDVPAGRCRGRQRVHLRDRRIPPRRVIQPTPNGPVTIATVRDPDGLLVLLIPGSITRRT